MTAVSPARPGDDLGSAGTPRSSRRNSSGTTKKQSVPVPAVPASAVSAKACQAISSRAPQSPT